MASVVIGCGSSATGPTTIDDAVRVPLANALTLARSQSGFLPFGGTTFGIEPLRTMVVRQLQATGRIQRSRRDGMPTDPISDEEYTAVAIELDFDFITEQGIRFTHSSLHILAWSGLDQTRGEIESVFSLNGRHEPGPMAPAVYPFVGGSQSGSVLYYYAPTGRLYDSSPTGDLTIIDLRSDHAGEPCRGPIPADVVCMRSSGVGTVSGSYGFFARGIAPPENTGVLEIARTNFTLPVTRLRIVDTLRFH